MVQTNSHKEDIKPSNYSNVFNTHVKRFSLSASVVIIIITRLHATSRIITQYSIIYCYTVLPPVHSNLMSHYQLSNFAIDGFEHLETDINSK